MRSGHGGGLDDVDGPDAGSVANPLSDVLGIGLGVGAVDDDVSLRGGDRLLLAQGRSLGPYEHRDADEEPDGDRDGNEGCGHPAWTLTQLPESLGEHQPSNPAIASLTASAVGEAMSSTMRPSSSMRTRSA